MNGHANINVEKHSTQCHAIGLCTAILGCFSQMVDTSLPPLATFTFVCEQYGTSLPDAPTVAMV